MESVVTFSGGTQQSVRDSQGREIIKPVGENLLGAIKYAEANTLIEGLLSSHSIWEVDGFSIMPSVSSHDSIFPEKGISSFTKVSDNRSSLSKRLFIRWKLALQFEEATDENFDLEWKYNVYNRDDKIVGEKKSKLIKSHITLDIPEDDQYGKVGEHRVYSEIKSLNRSFREFEKSTETLESFVKFAQGILITCTNCGNFRNIASFEFELPPANCVTKEDLESRLRCSECGLKGKARVGAVVGPIKPY